MPTRLILALGIALAISSKGFAHDEDAALGRTAEAAKAQRTIRVEMRDPYEFSPAQITVTAGEIVRFQVVNTGKHVHEMVLGTMKGLDEHNELMKAYPHMEHDEPNMVQLRPGKTGEIVWQFTRPGEFFFGCLVEDHYDMGMFGKIRVVPRPRARAQSG